MKVITLNTHYQQFTHYIFRITRPITTHLFDGEACIEYRYFNRAPKVTFSTDKTTIFYSFLPKKATFSAISPVSGHFCNPPATGPPFSPFQTGFLTPVQGCSRPTHKMPPKFGPGLIFLARPNRPPSRVPEATAVTKIQPPKERLSSGFQTLAKWQMLKPYQ